jgi:hypothetical protein
MGVGVAARTGSATGFSRRVPTPARALTAGAVFRVFFFFAGAARFVVLAVEERTGAVRRAVVRADLAERRVRRRLRAAAFRPERLRRVARVVAVFLAFLLAVFLAFCLAISPLLFGSGGPRGSPGAATLAFCPG